MQLPWAKATGKNPSYRLIRNNEFFPQNPLLLSIMASNAGFLRNEVLLVKMSLKFFIHFTKKEKETKWKF